MKWFSLKEVCRTEMINLQTSVLQKSRIKLSIDIQLPDSLVGDIDSLFSRIIWLTRWLDSKLINGVVIIDLFKRSQSNDDIVVVAQVTGLGMKAINTPDTSFTEKEHTFLQSEGIRVKHEDDRLIFEFNVDFKSFESRQAEVPALLHKCILVAEDSEINALVFSGFMEEWGCEIVVVQNGRDAIDQASRNSFDLILMDIHMPVMGGNDAIKAIRKIDRNIPIVSLTASVLESDIEESLENGANDYLLKPVASKTLFNVLKKYLVPNRDPDRIIPIR